MTDKFKKSTFKGSAWHIQIKLTPGKIEINDEKKEYFSPRIEDQRNIVYILQTSPYDLNHPSTEKLAKAHIKDALKECSKIILSNSYEEK